MREIILGRVTKGIVGGDLGRADDSPTKRRESAECLGNCEIFPYLKVLLAAQPSLDHSGCRFEALSCRQLHR